MPLMCATPTGQKKIALREKNAMDYMIVGKVIAIDGADYTVEQIATSTETFTLTEVANGTDPEQAIEINDIVIVGVDKVEVGEEPGVGIATIIAKIGLPRYQDDAAASGETGAYEVVE